jgi:6-phosphogluconolactonase
MTTLQVEIYPDRATLVARSLTLVCERLQTAITERGRATIALAGGSTPKPLYEALAQAELPWSQLQVFWGDERFVPIAHADSNAGMAKAAWLDQVPMPPANVHITPTHLETPAAAAAAYEVTVRQRWGSDLPQLDVVLR